MEEKRTRKPADGKQIITPPRLYRSLRVMLGLCQFVSFIGIAAGVIVFFATSKDPLWLILAAMCGVAVIGCQWADAILDGVIAVKQIAAKSNAISSPSD